MVLLVTEYLSTRVALSDLKLFSPFAGMAIRGFA